MNAVVRPRSACRICGDPALDRYVDLGNLPLTDQFLGPRDPGPAFLHPVSVWRCRACGVSQTQHDVASVDYLRDYRYTAAQSPFVAAFNRRLARAAFERFGTRPGDTVIEAGSGDGALLACFRDLGCRVLGFEPSAPLSAASRAAGIPVIDSVFDENSPARMEPGTGPVRLAVMTYTFDHLPDPPQSLEAMRRMLDPESGVLILEVHDLDRILARGESCLFEHEHTIYCSASTLQGLLARSGFALVSIDLVPEAARRANSLLAAAAPSGSRWAASAMPPLPPGPFGTVDACVRAGQDVQRALERIRTWITSRMAGGVRLAGYGAGGRGVMTLAAVARSGDFAFVCDANPALHGLRCPGSDVVVVPPDRLADAPVDEVLVFSFGYLDEIAASLAGFRLRGGRLVSLLDVMAG